MMIKLLHFCGVVRLRLTCTSRVVGFAGLLVGVAACRDSIGPEPLTCTNAAVPFCTEPPEAKAAVVEATSDAQTRSVGALKNGSAAQALSLNLMDLSTALSAGEISRARSALARSRQELEKGRGQLSTYPGDAPDLTAIELALIQVERRIQ
jgi:hypothetical protein